MTEDFLYLVEVYIEIGVRFLLIGAVNFVAFASCQITHQFHVAR